MLAVLLHAAISAPAQGGRPVQMDSIEIGLLTCSPHDEVYSLYGHTALHVHDLRSGRHVVFNYGVFDYKKPHFVWRFMMGQTDYLLEAVGSLDMFCAYYQRWGSQVEEQILNLTAQEKIRLLQALDANLRNPVYRYNFFYDNCSTRPRNIVERSLEGSISYGTPENTETTFRQVIHRCTEQHPWAAFGNDLLLGFKADTKTTGRERQFLPANLCWDFDHATVERQGVKQPLVLRHVVLVPPGSQPKGSEFPLSPRACTLLLLLGSVLIMGWERRRRRTLVWWDALLMLGTGLPGCILLLMFFSEHPATSTNLQILLLNPVALFFIPAVVRRRKTRWFAISLACLIAFFIGGFWQDYAEGMETVALCLLLRYWIHRHDK